MRSSAVLRLLANRNYAIYTAGNTLSLIGTWIQSIAFGWLVWEMTGSPFWLGLIAASGLIPTLFGGLAGGVFADRHDRLKLTALTQILSFLVTFALFVCFRLDVLSLGLLVLFKVLLSGLASFSQPARMALIPSLVGRDQLVQAVSFGSMVFNTARFVGPAIAGVIIAVSDAGWAFLANSISFLAMAGAIALLRFPEKEKDVAEAAIAPRRSRPGWSDLTGGVAYLRDHPGVRVLFLLLIAVVLFARPISDFFPAMATDIFGRGIEAVATMTSAMALGSLVGGFYAVGRGIAGLARSGLIACAVYTLFLILFLNMPNFWAGCVLLAFVGFCSVLFVTAAQTLIQVRVDDAVRGRVLSLWLILSRAGPDAGALMMGVAAEAAGLVPAFTAGALICLAASLWSLTWLRTLAAPPPAEASG